MKVLYCAAECKPFAKAGGVGDVAGELPLALKELGIDIEIAMPLYGSIDSELVENQEQVGSPLEVRYAGGTEKVTVRRGRLGDVPVYFFKNATFFGGPEVYIHSEPTPFLDDIKRFSFFSEALLAFVRSHQPDIVHINDWVLGYLFGRMAMEGFEQKRVLTVHNVGYQGLLYDKKASNLHINLLLKDSRIGSLFVDPRKEWHSVNALRLALELADAANTVSPTYCAEMTKPENEDAFFEGGKGLDRIAKRMVSDGRLIGILNGFVYKQEPTEEAFWDTIERKRQARSALANRFSDPDALLIGFVGRAVEQKFRLLQEKHRGKPILEHILDLEGVNVAMLATGLPEYESFMNGVATQRQSGLLSYDSWLQAPRRKNYACTIAFDRELARTISLGCDVFLVPSLFEPCGITQLESMSNATPPLVRLTGGLADTVTPHPDKDSTGFGFQGKEREEVLESLLQCVVMARDFRNEAPGAFLEMQRRAFEQRYEWGAAAKKYKQDLYEPVMAGRHKASF